MTLQSLKNQGSIGDIEIQAIFNMSIMRDQNLVGNNPFSKRKKTFSIRITEALVKDTRWKRALLVLATLAKENPRTNKRIREFLLVLNLNPFILLFHDPIWVFTVPIWTSISPKMVETFEMITRKKKDFNERTKMPTFLVAPTKLKNCSKDEKLGRHWNPCPNNNKEAQPQIQWICEKQNAKNRQPS